MEIVIFANRFRNGSWEVWKHSCSVEEVDGVADSALPKAQDRGHTGHPLPIDYLAGARYMFEVARGLADNPREGDTRVHGVCVNGMVIGDYEELRRHFEVAREAA